MGRWLFCGLAALALALTAALSSPAQTATQNEGALFQQAQKTGLFSDYEAYLAAYPNGVHAEAARFEMQWALKPTDGATAQTGIAYDTPMLSDNPALNGLSIEDLVHGTPLFSPIEGLPEALWKDVECSSCHAWTPESLCTQGLTYTGVIESKSLKKQHPYGGLLKSALRTFAVEGCK